MQDTPESATTSAGPDGALLVVIPTYNERENIAELIASVRGQLPEAEVLVVDDASPDGTGEIVEALAAYAPWVHLLSREGKLGLGTAYAEGFRWAWRRGFRRAAQLDADGSHDPAVLSSLIGRLDEADLVIGSRAVAGGGVRGWSARRQLLSRAASRYCRLWLGWDLSDPTSGYRAIGPRALEALATVPLRSEGFAFQIEVAFKAHRLGLRIVEHPIVFTARARGRSKLSAEIVAEALLVVPLLRLGAGAFGR